MLFVDKQRVLNGLNERGLIHNFKKMFYYSKLSNNNLLLRMGFYRTKTKLVFVSDL